MAIPVISPFSATVAGAATQQYTADQSVTWKVDGITGGNGTVGTISGGGLYTAPNISGTYNIQGVNGSSEVGNAFAVVGSVFPFVPNFQYEGKADKRVLNFIAEDGSRQTRTKRTKKRSYDLVFQYREASEYLAMEAFWDQHYPSRSFTFTDVILNFSGLYLFVGELSHRADSYNTIEYRVSILEK